MKSQRKNHTNTLKVVVVSFPTKAKTKCGKNECGNHLMNMTYRVLDNYSSDATITLDLLLSAADSDWKV